MVREIPDPSARAQCELPGVVEESAAATAVADGLGQGMENMSASMDERSPRDVGQTRSTEAMTKVRNSVAELGGDASIIVGGDDYVLQAEAYRSSDEDAPVIPTTAG